MGRGSLEAVALVEREILWRSLGPGFRLRSQAGEEVIEGGPGFLFGGRRGFDPRVVGSGPGLETGGSLEFRAGGAIHLDQVLQGLGVRRFARREGEATGAVPGALLGKVDVLQKAGKVGKRGFFRLFGRLGGPRLSAKAFSAGRKAAAFLEVQQGWGRPEAGGVATGEARDRLRVQGSGWAAAADRRWARRAPRGPPPRRRET
jgi:hypothetical protein